MAFAASRPHFYVRRLRRHPVTSRDIAWLIARWCVLMGGILATGLNASAAMSHVETTLHDLPGVTASMDIDQSACPQTLPVTVQVQTAAQLQNPRVLSQVMAWAQLAGLSVCPDVASIHVSAIDNERRVYQGTARRDDGWTLTERAPAIRRPAITTAVTESPPFPVVAQRAPVENAAPARGLTAPKVPHRGAEQPVHPSRTNDSVAQTLPPTHSAGDESADNAGTASTDSTVVSDCDRLATHPDDPDAKAPGVKDDQLDANRAVPACEAAVRQADVARLHFELARAYLKADRGEDAVEQLVVGAEKGSGGALAYLADIYASGAPGLGIEADPVLAKSLYEKAATANFHPAQQISDQFEDVTSEVQAASDKPPQPGGAELVTVASEKPASGFQRLIEAFRSFLATVFQALANLWSDLTGGSQSTRPASASSTGSEAEWLTSVRHSMQRQAVPILVTALVTFVENSNADDEIHRRA